MCVQARVCVCVRVSVLNAYIRVTPKEIRTYNRSTSIKSSGEIETLANE